MYWGRHVDVLLKAYRKDDSLRYLLRQRQYPWPEQRTLVLEMKDQRTREEARSDWEANRHYGKRDNPGHPFIFTQGLPDGWAGVWSKRLPRIATAMARLQAKAMLDDHGDSWIALQGRLEPSKSRLASVYGEGDTAAFEATFWHPDGRYAPAPHPAHSVALKIGDETMDLQTLARPVNGHRVEVTYLFTFV